MIFRLTPEGIVKRRRSIWIGGLYFAAFFSLIQFLLCHHSLADGSLSPSGFWSLFSLMVGLPAGGLVMVMTLNLRKPDEVELDREALLRRRDGKMSEVPYASIQEMKVAARSGRPSVIFLRAGKNRWTLHDYEDMPRLASGLEQALTPGNVETKEALPPNPLRRAGMVGIFAGIGLLAALAVVLLIMIGSWTGSGIPILLLMLGISGFGKNRNHPTKRILAILSILAAVLWVALKFFADR
ncbi:MAG TPA: hypothetical protein VFR02_08500 [bacterium]|nr:hypothetical protein [bacterium]